MYIPLDVTLLEKVPSVLLDLLHCPREVESRGDERDVAGHQIEERQVKM